MAYYAKWIFFPYVLSTLIIPFALKKKNVLLIIYFLSNSPFYLYLFFVFLFSSFPFSENTHFTSVLQGFYLHAVKNAREINYTSIKNKYIEFLMWFSGLKNRRSVHGDVGWILGLAQWIPSPQCILSDIATSYNVVRRCSSDLVLLWIWHSPSAAAPI